LLPALGAGALPQPPAQQHQDRRLRAVGGARFTQSGGAHRALQIDEPLFEPITSASPPCAALRETAPGGYLTQTVDSDAHRSSSGPAYAATASPMARERLRYSPGVRS